MIRLCSLFALLFCLSASPSFAQGDNPRGWPLPEDVTAKERRWILHVMTVVEEECPALKDFDWSAPNLPDDLKPKITLRSPPGPDADPLIAAFMGPPREGWSLWVEIQVTLAVEEFGHMLEVSWMPPAGLVKVNTRSPEFCGMTEVIKDDGWGKTYFKAAPALRGF